MDKIDIAQREAYNALKNYSPYAVIYGYNTGSGFHPLHPVLMKENQEQVQEYGKMLMKTYEGRNGVTLYVFYRSQLSGLIDYFGDKGYIR